MAGAFDQRKDSRLKVERRSDDFVRLIFTLELLKLNVTNHKINIQLRQCSDSYYSEVADSFTKRDTVDYAKLSGKLDLESAYSLIKAKYYSKKNEYWRHLENDFTCMPDDYPFTVDYIL